MGESTYERPSLPQRLTRFVFLCVATTTAVLSLIGATSVTSFYIVVVLGLAGLSKTFFARPLNLVPMEEMPQPDELIEVCKGIHTLRAQGKLKDEMQMFKVRSPVRVCPTVSHVSRVVSNYRCYFEYVDHKSLCSASQKRSGTQSPQLQGFVLKIAKAASNRNRISYSRAIISLRTAPTATCNFKAPNAGPHRPRLPCPMNTSPLGIREILQSLGFGAWCAGHTSKICWRAVLASIRASAIESDSSASAIVISAYGSVLVTQFLVHSSNTEESYR